jgi:hypothetical protein
MSSLLRASTLVLLAACSTPPSAPTPPCAAPTEAPIRRLTREEYANTVRTLLGLRPPAAMASFPLDDKEASFDANRTPATELIVDAYHQAAVELATALPTPARWAGCDGADSAACLRTWLPRFLERAERRPPTVEEVQLLEPLLTQGSPDEVVRATIEVVLQSPAFLYHLEGGSGREAFGIAARLASLLWASAPDDELLEAARSGALLRPDERRRQAERMLADARAVAGLGSFHVQWLEVDVLPTLEKEPSLSPAWGPATTAALIDEVRALSAFFIRRGDARLDTMLSSPAALATPDVLSSVYGLSASEPFDGERVVAAPGRSGLLTTGAFLATHAHRDQTSPVKRGFVIRDRFLCQKPVPPPPDVNNAPPPLDPNATTKERFAAHTSNPACAGCHAITDPIGWGFEAFDAVGRQRRTEGGRTVDDSGELTGTDVDGPFVGTAGLAHRLSRSALVSDCVTTQWVRFALRRLETDVEQCQLEALKTTFRTSGGNVRSLLLAIAESNLLLTEAP